MTRFASSTNQTAASGANLRVFVAVDLDFASGHVRAHDGVGTITFLGGDYLGVGKFGGISIAEESVEVIAKPVTLSLSGVDPSLVSTATTETYQGRTATLYFGLQDVDSYALIDTPEILWEGRMDQMTIKLGPSEASITLNCEHRLRREPRIARYTDADMQVAYSGDRFFDLIGKIAGFRGTWGAKGAANNGASLLPQPTYTTPYYSQWPY